MKILHGSGPKYERGQHPKNISKKKPPFLQKFCNYRELSKEEERDLIERMLNGDRSAKDKLVTNNVALVAIIAGEFSCFTKHLKHDDLVSIGLIEIMENIHKFDPKREAELSTYLALLARVSMLEAVKNLDSTIRLPLNRHKQIQAIKDDKKWDKLNRKRKKPVSKDLVYLLSVLNRQSTVELNSISAESTHKQADSDQRGSLVLSEKLNPQSLADGENHIHPNPIEALLYLNELELLQTALGNLPETQQRLLECRFNLGRKFKKPLTLVKIAQILFDEFGISSNKKGSDQAMPISRQAVLVRLEQALNELLLEMLDLDFRPNLPDKIG